MFEGQAKNSMVNIFRSRTCFSIDLGLVIDLFIYLESGEHLEESCEKPYDASEYKLT
jgi:hypothetical protein